MTKAVRRSSSSRALMVVAAAVAMVMVLSGVGCPESDKRSGQVATPEDSGEPPGGADAATSGDDLHSPAPDAAPAADIPSDLYYPSADPCPWSGAPGALCAPCNFDEECESGHCLPSVEGWFCTEGCEADCPAGLVCKLDGYCPGDNGLCVLPSDVGGEPEPGEAGAPCAANDDCYSGYCVESPEGFVCTANCAAQDQCPPGFVCKGIALPGGDLAFLCLPATPHHCDPCLQDYQCGPCGACLSIDGEQRCAEGCLTAADCPPGYACTADPTGEHEGSWCQPLTSSCSCNQDGLNPETRSCVVENEHGACAGVAYCDPEVGWSPCDAPVPAPEVCDGLDNDCDGVADDGVCGCLADSDCGAHHWCKPGGDCDDDCMPADPTCCDANTCELDCTSFEDPDECPQEACYWHYPGCGEGTLAEPGCNLPVQAPCAGDLDCKPGLSCQEVGVLLCWGPPCEVCTEPLGLCLP